MLIVSDIDLRIKRFLNDPLPDGGSINASEYSVREYDRAGKILVVFILGGYECVADTLTR